jgi:hypothetical protein
MRRQTAILSCIVIAALSAGCNSSGSHAAGEESEAYCRSVKPGEVTTVNHYCAVMNEDPVDPSLSHEWNGQKVGFCCKGCIPRWEKMSDEQKTAALAAAVAKGKPQQ